MELKKKQPTAKGPAEWFTGDVWFDVIAATDRLRVNAVRFSPGEWHWHGAAPEHFMTHLAIWEGLVEGQAGPETEWADHVIDEYPGS